MERKLFEGQFFFLISSIDISLRRYFPFDGSRKSCIWVKLRKCRPSRRSCFWSCFFRFEFVKSGPHLISL
jgi:hypothetical protein